MTKWAEYLEGILQNPEAFLQNRLYKLKTVDHQLVDLDNPQELVDNLKREYKKVKSKFSNILGDSYGFIGQVLSKSQDSVASSVARFNETRVLSSQVNAVLTKLILSYTNILIHHLLKAGQGLFCTDR